MSSGSSPALTILIIRHAEKHGEQWPGPGLTPEGVQDDKSLVIRGWQRAGAWAALFGTELGGEKYPRPNMIYAANPDTSPIEEPSQRPFQTVIPLCKRLDLPPIVDFQVGQERELASAIVSGSGVILASWEHKAIANQLLPSIAGGQQIKNLPQQWDETRYDLVLRFDRSAPGVPWNFRQLCPCLLSEDSAKLME
ncbi:MAG TPA: hypothetical protein VE641_18245 [Chthoniobacterales bacterium]|jgi:hypothetical protein|nr:hypothetical protein [Chthoniobacterales bacterium]